MSLAGGRKRLEALMGIKNTAPEKRRCLPFAGFFQMCVMPHISIFFDIYFSNLLRHIENHCTSAPFILFLYINYYLRCGAVMVQMGCSGVQIGCRCALWCRQMHPVIVLI